MLTIEQAWGKNPALTEVAPAALAVCTVACALNLTGARFVSNAALINDNNRLATLAQSFLSVVNFIQRDYHKHPDHIIAILGSGVPMSAVILDHTDGSIVYDPNESSRVSQVGNFYMYRKAENRPHVYAPQGLRVMEKISYIDAVKQLRTLGLWVDHAWGYDQDNARGSNYL